MKAPRETTRGDDLEPHPLDYDWRFTPTTSERIGRLLPKQGTTLLLGTHSVVPFVPGGDPSSVVLVDWNPLIAESTDSHFIVDLRHEELFLPSGMSFSGVVIDAPWYPDDLFAWIHHAMRYLDTGGLMLIVLWRDNTRPTASKERQEILTFLSGIGRTDVYAELVRYTTPQFERIALTHAGVPVGPEWRAADLVAVRLENRIVPPQLRQLSHSPAQWSRFSLDSRQIAIRIPRSDHARSVKPDLRPVEHTDEWVLPSVSRRDPRRQLVDIWTSRNFVAQATNPEAFVAALSKYAQNPSGCEGADAAINDEWAETALALLMSHDIIPQDRPKRIRQWRHRD